MAYLEETGMDEKEIEKMMREEGIEANATLDKSKCKSAVSKRMEQILKSAAKYTAKWNMEAALMFFVYLGVEKLKIELEEKKHEMKKS